MLKLPSLDSLRLLMNRRDQYDKAYKCANNGVESLKKTLIKAAVVELNRSGFYVGREIYCCTPDSPTASYVFNGMLIEDFDNGLEILAVIQMYDGVQVVDFKKNVVPAYLIKTNVESLCNKFSPTKGCFKV